MTQRSDLECLRRRRQRYRDLLNKMKSPGPSSFFAYGNKYSLPFRFKDPPLIERAGSISEHQLQSFGAYFDSVGTACLHTDGKTPIIQIVQSAHHLERLIDFARAFGGKIYSAGPIRAGRAAAVHWTARKSDAVAVANSLLPFCQCKAARLEIISRWTPKMSQFLIEQWADDFVNEKQEVLGRRVRHFDNWYEFGAFVDPMISVGTSACGKVHVSFGCYNESLMFVIQEFLSREGLAAADSSVTVTGKSGWVFRIYQFDSIVELARRLLPYVSQCHRHLVVIVQYANNSISAERTQHILALNGNKTKFCRNSTDTMNITKRLDYLKSKKMARVDDAQEIENLTYKRALLQQEHQTNVLAVHIREMLSNGAQLRKPKGERHPSIFNQDSESKKITASVSL